MNQFCPRRIDHGDIEAKVRSLVFCIRVRSTPAAPAGMTFDIAAARAIRSGSARDAARHRRPDANDEEDYI